MGIKADFIIIITDAGSGNLEKADAFQPEKYRKEFLMDGCG
jgi:hypothetical protein